MTTTDKLSDMAIQIFTEATDKVYSAENRTRADSSRYNVKVDESDDLSPRELSEKAMNIVQGLTSTYSSRQAHGQGDEAIPFGNVYNPNFKVSYAGGEGTPSVSLTFQLAIIPEMLESGGISASHFSKDDPAFSEIAGAARSFMLSEKNDEHFPLKGNLWTMTDDISVTPYFRQAGTPAGKQGLVNEELTMKVPIGKSNTETVVQLTQIKSKESCVYVKPVLKSGPDRGKLGDEIRVEFKKLPGMRGEFNEHTKDPSAPAGFDEFFGLSKLAERPDEEHKVERGPISGKYDPTAATKRLRSIPVAVNWPAGVQLPEDFYRDSSGTVWASKEAIQRWRTDHPAQPLVAKSTQPPLPQAAEPSEEPVTTKESAVLIPSFLEFITENAFETKTKVPFTATETNRPISVKLKCGPVIHGNVSPNDFIIFDEDFLREKNLTSIDMDALSGPEFEDVKRDYIAHLKSFDVQDADGNTKRQIFAWKHPSEASTTQMTLSQSYRDESGELVDDPRVSALARAHELGDPMGKAPTIDASLTGKRRNEPRYSTKVTGLPPGKDRSEYEEYFEKHGGKIVTLRVHDTYFGGGIVEIPADLIDWKKTNALEAGEREISALKIPVLAISMRTRLQYLNKSVPGSSGGKIRSKNDRLRAKESGIDTTSTPSYFARYRDAQKLQTKYSDIDWSITDEIEDNTRAVYEMDLRQYVLWYDNNVSKLVKRIAESPAVGGSPDKVQAKRVHLKSVLRGKFANRAKKKQYVPLDQPLTYKPLRELMYASNDVLSSSAAYSNYNYDEEVQQLLLVNQRARLPSSGFLDESEFRDPELTQHFSRLLNEWLNGYVVDPDKEANYTHPKNEPYDAKDPKNIVTEFQDILPARYKNIDWNEYLDTTWSQSGIMPLKTAVRIIVDHLKHRYSEGPDEEPIRAERTSELYDSLSPQEQRTFDAIKQFVFRGSINKDELTPETFAGPPLRKRKKIQKKLEDPELARKFEDMIEGFISDKTKNAADINIAKAAKELVVNHLKSSERGKIIARSNPKPMIPVESGDNSDIGTEAPEPATESVKIWDLIPMW